MTTEPDATSAAEGLCVVARQPHPPAHGMLICDKHYNHLAETLLDIELEAVLVDTRPSMATSYEHGTTLASQRSPARLDAILVNDGRRGTAHLGADQHDPWGLDDTPSAIEVLHSRARTVREERKLTDPDRITITGERRLLSFHLDWIAQQPWVDEMWAEMRGLRAHLLNINTNQDDRPLPGRCYLIRETDGTECGGNLWTVKPKHTSGYVQNGPDAVQCDRDKDHRWEGIELARLALAINQDVA